MSFISSRLSLLKRFFVGIAFRRVCLFQLGDKDVVLAQTFRIDKIVSVKELIAELVDGLKAAGYTR